jgi:hypothetical protein
MENYIAMNQKPDNRKWICPCQPLDRPIILYRDEFMMRLLEIARSDDHVCTISENLEIKFGADRIYKVHGNQIVPLLAGVEDDSSSLENTDKTNSVASSSSILGNPSSELSNQILDDSTLCG